LALCERIVVRHAAAGAHPRQSRAWCGIASLL